MANSLYAKGRNHFAQGDIHWKATSGDTIRAMLASSSGYTPDLTNHEFLSSVPAAARAGNNGGQTRADMPALTLLDPVGGTCDANDIVFNSVPTGGPWAYLILFKDTGDDATSPLIACIDTATGLPVTTNGGNINVAWSDLADKIFTL